jgi:inhibitor of cysteine peptidase
LTGHNDESKGEKMKKLSESLLFVCLLICAAVTACGAKRSGSVTLTQKDAGTTVHVKQGANVNITLDGNPTTGYTWEVAPGGSSVLEQQGDPASKPDSSAVGSGGMVTLKFKAAQAGTINLKLVYHRTFEPNVVPLHTFEVKIVVE